MKTECLSHRFTAAQARIARLDAGAPSCGFMASFTGGWAADGNGPSAFLVMTL